MVSAAHLAKVYRDPKSGEVRALNDVSFEVHPGQIFGLLGVNGAGKTTCLRILSTVIKATNGTATVAGYDVERQDLDVRRSIGFLSTSTALYGRLNGREVLDYFGKLAGLSGGQLAQRKDFVIETLRLQEFLDRPCDKLSTGQKQRISIARTILHDPPVLFFDEPTAGLDVVTSQTIMEFIESVRGQGKTVIFSTHIMSEAERLCDQIAVIHQGEIKARGTVQEIIALNKSVNLERAFLDCVGYVREMEPAR